MNGYTVKYQPRGDHHEYTHTLHPATPAGRQAAIEEAGAWKNNGGWTGDPNSLAVWVEHGEETVYEVRS